MTTYVQPLKPGGVALVPKVLIPEIRRPEHTIQSGTPYGLIKHDLSHCVLWKNTPESDSVAVMVSTLS